MDLTVPATVEGISILALSLSSVIRDCSTATVSPTLTNTSITSISSKSPISGTTTVVTPEPVVGEPDAGASAAGAGASVAAAWSVVVCVAVSGVEPVSAEASDALIFAIRSPSDNLSPTLTSNSVIVPP